MHVLDTYVKDTKTNSMGLFRVSFTQWHLLDFYLIANENNSQQSSPVSIFPEKYQEKSFTQKVTSSHYESAESD